MESSVQWGIEVKKQTSFSCFKIKGNDFSLYPFSRFAVRFSLLLFIRVSKFSSIPSLLSVLFFMTGFYQVVFLSFPLLHCVDMVYLTDFFFLRKDCLFLEGK